MQLYAVVVEFTSFTHTHTHTYVYWTLNEVYVIQTHNEAL